MPKASLTVLQIAPRGDGGIVVVEPFRCRRFRNEAGTQGSGLKVNRWYQVAVLVIVGAVVVIVAVVLVAWSRIDGDATQRVVAFGAENIDP
jgi:hypothetical protein